MTTPFEIIALAIQKKAEAFDPVASFINSLRSFISLEHLRIADEISHGSGHVDIATGIDHALYMRAFNFPNLAFYHAFRAFKEDIGLNFDISCINEDSVAIRFNV